LDILQVFHSFHHFEANYRMAIFPVHHMWWMCTRNFQW